MTIESALTASVALRFAAAGFDVQNSVSEENGSLLRSNVFWNAS